MSARLILVPVLLVAILSANLTAALGEDVSRLPAPAAGKGCFNSILQLGSNVPVSTLDAAHQVAEIEVVTIEDKQVGWLYRLGNGDEYAQQIKDSNIISRVVGLANYKGGGLGVIGLQPPHRVRYLKLATVAIFEPCFSKSYRAVDG